MLSPHMKQAAQITESAAGKIQQQYTKLTGGNKQMSASLNELKTRLEAVNNVRFSTRYEREFRAATREAQRLENQIARLEGRGRSGGGGSMVGDFIKGNLLAGFAQQAISAVGNELKQTYNTGMQMSSFRTSINATTNGQGASAMRQTESIADRYGVNYEASLEGVRTLTGGLKGLNMPLAEQMKIFEGITTGVAAMKLNSEAAKGAFLALGQMASKGTVQAEELRGQLGERIPGAFGIAAAAMGVTEAKLNSMLQRGEVASKDFLPRFAAQMQKTFGADAMAAANGPQAIQERFNNAIFKMRAVIGEGLMPVITPVIQAFTGLATSILPTIQSTISVIVGLINGTIEPSGVLNTWWTLIKDQAIAIWQRTSGILMTVWNLIKQMGVWLANSVLIQDIFWAIGKLAQGVLWFVQKIGDVLQWIWSNVIKPVLDAIEWAYVKIKSLMGFGGQTVKVQAEVGKVPKIQIADPLNKQFTAPAGGPPKPDYGLPVANQKADAVNNGGQRSIKIEIGKQIEKLEIHVVGGAQEVAQEVETAVQEVMRRVFLTLNAQTN